jgi:electron transfer flavoprotein alpha subunit
MSGVLVVAEGTAGDLRAGSLEAIGLAATLRDAAGGRVVVAIVDPEPDTYVGALALEGVDEIVSVPAAGPRLQPHAVGAALDALIDSEQPTLVLAGQTINALGWAPALAARRGLGFASDVTAVDWGEELVARRPAYGGKLEAELDFPGKGATLLLLRPGGFAVAVPAAAAPPVRTVDVGPAGATTATRFVSVSEEQAGDVDISTAPFLIAVGRGVEEQDDLEQFVELADEAGATLGVSRPLVDAGWMPASRQVGQSGKTVEPEVYLAFGISGAVQHLAGIRKAKTVIAVNTDPDAPIFQVADYGAVADMFDVASELARLLGDGAA